MASDDYQLMSRKEIVGLKDQLKKLKQGNITPDKNMQAVMERLQKTMLDLITLFREASQEMKSDDSEQGIAAKLDEVSTRLDILIDQNEKLAEGIIGVADLVKESPKGAAEDTGPQPSTAPPEDRFIPTQMPASEPMPAVNQPGPPPGMPPQPSPPPAPGTPPPPLRTQRRPFPNFFK